MSRQNFLTIQQLTLIHSVSCAQFLNEKLEPIYNRFHCSELVNAERDQRASNPELNTVIQRNQSVWCVQGTSPFIKISKYIGTMRSFEPVIHISTPSLTDMGLILYRNKIYILGGMRASAQMCTNIVSSYSHHIPSIEIHETWNVHNRFATSIFNRHHYFSGRIG